jgi:hypothetical protein
MSVDLYQMWLKAGGGTDSYDRERHRDLAREAGVLVHCECSCHAGGSGHCDRCKPALPCGWPGPQKPAEEWWCEKFEMPASGCSHCTGRRGDEAEVSDRPDPAGFGDWFPAKYHGRCSGCDEHIRPDDRIRGDGEGAYVCEREGCGS